MDHRLFFAEPRFAPDTPSDGEGTQYSTVARKEIPEEFTWDLTHLFADLQAWEVERDRIKGLEQRIADHQGSWTRSAENMLAFYQFLDDLYINGSKAYQYASFLNNMELDNPQYRKMLGEMQFIFNQIQSKLAFIEPDIVQLGEETFEQFLSEKPELEDYSTGVRNTLRRAQHILPKEQARIVSLTGMFARTPSQASSALNNVDIPNPVVTLSDGREYTLNYSTFARLRSSKDPRDRQLVVDTFFDNISKYENTFSILLDGEMKRHLFSATVRDYGDTLSARMDVDNIDTEVYNLTVEQVRQNLEPLHRHLQLKGQLLGLDEFRYVDMYASAVPAVERNYTWKEAHGLVEQSLQLMGPDYLKPFNRAFEERWIDRYPNKGKQSGAFSSGVYGVHPYVKMNFTGDFNNVSTLTHEMGHAMHSWFSNNAQPYAKHDYTIFLAEIASTFNEHMLIDHLLSSEDDPLFKLYVLDEYLNGLRGTIYRQSLFAEYERAMHQQAEQGQTLTPDWLNSTYLELTRHYYGHQQGVTKVDEYIQHEWSLIPHFFYNYYVIYYTTGIIASMALQKMVKEEGESGVAKYVEFLSAGSSDYSLKILKRAGVDMTTPQPYQAAAERLSSLVDEMETLVATCRESGLL